MPTPSFQPVSFSWVALHPQPKGVIQFIGGAFFGSFPTLFYRHLLTELYAAGYTLVAMPFRFSFRHWSIALSLLEEQQRLRRDLPQLAARLGYKTEPYQAAANYLWLGHSLGCKYIALLELLCGIALEPQNPAIEGVLGQAQADWLRHRLTPAVTIWDQSSLLMAPDISDTTSAIPIRTLARMLEALGLGVQPTRSQTLALIDKSDLFHLTAMLSYRDDSVAGSLQAPEPTNDVLWLYQHLQAQGLLHTELPGKHLEPLGLKIGAWLVDGNPLDKFAKPLAQWQTGHWLLEFAQKLKEMRNPT